MCPPLVAFGYRKRVVEYPQGYKVYYEFKSVKNLPPHDFVGQLSNDLTGPNFKVDNLRWSFDGRKISYNTET